MRRSVTILNTCSLLSGGFAVPPEPEGDAGEPKGQTGKEVGVERRGDGKHSASLQRRRRTQVQTIGMDGATPSGSQRRCVSHVPARELRPISAPKSEVGGGGGQECAPSRDTARSHSAGRNGEPAPALGGFSSLGRGSIGTMDIRLNPVRARLAGARGGRSPKESSGTTAFVLDSPRSPP